MNAVRGLPAEFVRCFETVLSYQNIKNAVLLGINDKKKSVAWLVGLAKFGGHGCCTGIMYMKHLKTSTSTFK